MDIKSRFFQPPDESFFYSAPAGQENPQRLVIVKVAAASRAGLARNNSLSII